MFVDVVKDIVKVAAILLALDAVFIYLIREHFTKQVESVQKTPLSLCVSSAILCYVALIFGFYYFVVLKRFSYLDAFLLGALIYVVFETTNRALFKQWQWNTVVIDSLWGGILFASTLYIFKVGKPTVP
jgi:uncharacterized membrane protein